MVSLVKQYEKRIYGFLIQYVKIPEEAEDMTQEILIKLWQNKERIYSIDDQEAYILAMTRNYIRDHFKKMSREKIYFQEVVDHLPVQDDSAFMIIKRKELESNIEAIILELPPRQQEVYHLFYKKGKTLVEIAKELKISPHTVKNHRAQALKFIQSRINPEMFLSGLILLDILLNP